MKRLFFPTFASLGLLISLSSLSSQPLFAQTSSSTDADPIPADGTTDATSAIQRHLDAFAATGGQVILPPGQYLIQGSLKVPSAVTLGGSWTAPHHGSEWKKGTTLLITGGRDQEDGPAAIQLSPDAAVEGLTLLWPEETWSDIRPYPWAIAGLGQHITVQNVTLVNAYQGIDVGQNGSLHLIRNVYGLSVPRNRRRLLQGLRADRFNPGYRPANHQRRIYRLRRRAQQCHRHGPGRDGGGPVCELQFLRRSRPRRLASGRHAGHPRRLSHPTRWW